MSDNSAFVFEMPICIYCTYLSI